MHGTLIGIKQNRQLLHNRLYKYVTQIISIFSLHTLISCMLLLLSHEQNFEKYHRLFDRLEIHTKIDYGNKINRLFMPIRPLAKCPSKQALKDIAKILDYDKHYSQLHEELTAKQWNDVKGENCLSNFANHILAWSTSQFCHNCRAILKSYGQFKGLYSGICHLIEQPSIIMEQWKQKRTCYMILMKDIHKKVSHQCIVDIINEKIITKKTIIQISD